MEEEVTLQPPWLYFVSCKPFRSCQSCQGPGSRYSSGYLLFNPIHFRHCPGSTRPPTPTPVQSVEATTYATFVQSVTIREQPARSFSCSNTSICSANACNTGKTEIKIEQGPSIGACEFHTGLSQRSASRHAPVGGGTGGTSTQQANDEEALEEERKRLPVLHLEVAYRMYEHFRQE